MKPVFIVRGLHADTPYVAHVTAVNAKGRSEPLLVRIVTLRPPETQKNIGSGKSEGQLSSSLTYLCLHPLWGGRVFVFHLHICARGTQKLLPL